MYHVNFKPLATMILKWRVVLLVCVNFSNIFGLGCEKNKECGACIGYKYERCVWCSAEDFKTPRCIPLINLSENNKTWCPVNNVYNPENEINDILTTNNKTKQLTPEIVQIKARPNVSVDFTITYKPALDQPLDVYIIFDNTGSMNQYKEEVSKQANKMFKRLEKISNNLLIGIGSFVEKPAKPYTAYHTNNVYSFKNELKLTKDMTALSHVINKMKSQFNSDDPESELDALMQAMVCGDKIGWRNDSRRYIVLFAENDYHSAGDGKMVGAIKPNDMKCHLENDIYNASLEFDYPSVGQINKVATENSFNILFAVTKTDTITYELLSDSIKGSHVGILNQPVSNIIVNGYKKIVSRIKMSYEKVPNVHVVMTPDCTKKNDKCLIEFKGKISVNVTLTVTDCPPDDNLKQTLFIGPEGLNEKVKIELETLCSCECEKNGILNASRCNQKGTFQCGVCKCNQNRSGKDCECDPSSATSTMGKDCESNFCSGHGVCRCGICNCYGGFNGELCEEFDDSCNFFQGRLCAGHGTCIKSKCQCYDGWTNDDCSCSTETNSCYPRNSDSEFDNEYSIDRFINSDEKPCTKGNGKCVCNRCVCPEKYSGKYCEYCEECAKKTCKDLSKDAECLFYNRTDCSTFKYETAENGSFVLSKEDIDSKNWHLPLSCKIGLENDSAIIFNYGYDPILKKWILAVQKEIENPPYVNIWTTVGSVIGSILVAGLLGIGIWHWINNIRDEREFKKFEAQAKSAGFNVSLQNPTYQDPVVVYRNPKYRIPSTS